MTNRDVDTAWNTYLGQCKICKKFGAVGGVSDTCGECKIAKNKWKESKKKGYY